MELLCPNCQKKLTVPEQYAGQLMRCPMCQGTFTVPALPSTVAAEPAGPVGFGAPPPPPQSEAYGVAPEPAGPAAPAPPLASETPSAASSAAPAQAAAAPASPSAGYSRICAMQIEPQVVQWLPLGIIVVFFLTFFPWHGTFTAWRIGFGSRQDELPTHALIIMFNLLTVVAAILAIASLLFSLKLIPDVPALRPILPMRSLIVGGIS